LKLRSADHAARAPGLRRVGLSERKRDHDTAPNVEQRRTFRLSKLSVFGLLGSTGVLVVAGFLSLFDPTNPYLVGACVVGFTAIGFFSLCVSMAASSCAQVLWRSPDHAKLRWIAIACACVCGLASLAGVYLGDAVVARHPVHMPPTIFMLAVGFLLTFIKPAMSFVIGACEEIERGAAEAADTVLQAKDARIGQLEKRNRELEDLLSGIKRDLAEAHAKPALQTMAAPAVQARSAPPAHASPRRGAGRRTDVDEIVVRTPSWDEMKTACAAVRSRGEEPSLRNMAAACRVPRSRINRALVENKKTFPELKAEASAEAA
jgi:hypothetical protein